MKTYTLTEVQELLRQQRELCAKEAKLETVISAQSSQPYRRCSKSAILNAPSPLLPTEEVGIKEDDGMLAHFQEKYNELKEDYNILQYKYSECVASKGNPQPSSSLASHSCTNNNSIRQKIEQFEWYAWDRKGMIAYKKGVPIEDVFILRQDVLDLMEYKSIAPGDWYSDEHGDIVTVLSVSDGWCMVRKENKKPFVVPEEFVLATFNK